MNSDGIYSVKENENENIVKTQECKSCGEIFTYTDSETKFLDYGTYSVKILECPCCKKKQGIKFIGASGLDVNNDERYYYG